MSVIGSNVLAGASGQAAGYEIERSLRFNNADSANLSRTFSSAGNRRTWTWSGWVKRGLLGTGKYGLFGGSGTNSMIRFNNDDGGDNLRVLDAATGGYDLITDRKFRDTSAWYHFVVAVDTTQSTAADRVKIYVNGAQETSFYSSSYPTQNAELTFNNNISHTIGYAPGSTYHDGYLADVHFIDGQALAPTDFGEYDDNNVWQPKEYTGTYPGNSFHLPFSDNSTAAALGTDTSGAGNNWTVNNLVADEPIKNYSNNGGSGLNASSSWANVFNGVVPANNSSYSDVAACEGGNTSTVTFSPALSGIIRVRISSSATSGTINGSISLSDSSSVSADVYPVSATWKSFGSKTNITSLTLNAGTNGGCRLSAIEVDGVVLADTTGANIDSLVDSPTNGTQADTGAGNEVVGNYCTLNPLSNGVGTNPTNGNLHLAAVAAVSSRCNSTIAVSSGKWYFETTLVAAATGNSPRTVVGIGQHFFTDKYVGEDADSYGFTLDQGFIFNNGTGTSYATALSNGDVFMCAFDLDNNKIFFGSNGTWFNSSDPAAGTSPAYTINSGTYCPAVRPSAIATNTPEVAFNFGQRAFAYTAPSGFNAINTASLSDPTIADGSTAMDVALYTGNGSTQTISGLDFSPDLVWLKDRNQGNNHEIFDIVRGSDRTLFPNLTNAEVTDANRLTSFNSNGFGLGANSNANVNGSSNVAWAWDAGTSTVSNTDGSITSSVRANPSAGFSIVTYTGDGTSGAGSSVGHGLGVAPAMVVTKMRAQNSGGSSTSNWLVYHKDLNGNVSGDRPWTLYLNETAAQADTEGWGDYGGFTSSVFTVSDVSSFNAHNNNSTSTYVAYCFAPVEGYSAFGSYIGNGSTDGPFVYTGMRPRWLMVKSTANNSGNWWIWDTSRNPYNAITLPLFANTSGQETSSGAGAHDILSNGFKFRDTGGAYNQSSVTYIYAAFAEHPFKAARAR